MKHDYSMTLRIFTLLLLAGYFLPGFAQHIIKGIVTDKGNVPLSGATCAVYASDSVLVSGSMADEKGKFALKGIAPGDYVLQVSFVGYQNMRIAIENLAEDVDLGTIVLQDDAQVLGEVSVVGSARKYNVDRQVLIPTQSQVTISNNAWTLMQNMQLARIRVNPVTNDITTYEGDKVILQINEVSVPKEEVIALRAQDIVRVEYTENPGARYQAGALVNYVVKERKQGGYVSAEGFQNLSSLGIKRYSLNSSYNWKKSQLGVIVGYEEMRSKWTRENEYRYQLPDYSFVRKEEGMPTKYKDQTLNATLKYTLYEADKYQFNATFRNKYKNVPNQFSDRKGYVTDSYTGERTFLQDYSQWKESSSSLDLYFQRNLKNKQLLLFNVVGTYIGSDNTHRYQEDDESGQVLSDIYSKIDGKKYSFIAEAVYEGSNKHSKWSVGAHHNQSYTDNAYTGDVVSDVNLRYMESYVFADYRYAYKKFSASVGLNGKYIRYSQKGEKDKNFYFEPRLQLQYLFTDNLMLRYNARISSYAPSLSSLNDTEQEVDMWQVTRGNPNLSTYQRYRQELLFSYNNRYFGIDIVGRYFYDDNPIMTSLFYEDGKIVSMDENHRNMHRLVFEPTLNLHPFGEYISLSVTPGMNRYIVNGNSYVHTYTHWYVFASLVASYKRWFLNASMNTRFNSLSGEVITYGEAFHQIALGYNAKRWNVTAGVMLPFTKEYSQASRNLSEIASSYSKVSTKSLSHLFFISASVNLDFGTKYKAGKQKRSNSDTDSGILSGSKRGMD